MKPFRAAVRSFEAVVVALLTLLAAAPTLMNGQSVGNNAVYNSSGQTFSSAYIDASAFAASANGPAGSSDLCSVLSYIYSQTGTAAVPDGAVIDARGIAVGTSIPCTSTNPWPTSVTVPSTTVLLPAGVIEIVAPWQVPSGTHLIGERRNTNIFPSGSAFTTTNYAIEMGPKSPCSCPASGCAPVIIEDVVIEGSATAPYPDINGIDNECSGSGSYIDHVALDLAGTGLNIGAGAAGSGPYTNINDIAGQQCGGGASCLSHCAAIGAATRGIHGMTCTMVSSASDTSPKEAGILLDGPNNSIEDVHFEGYYNGILVGDTASAAGSTLLNITSGDGGNTGPTVNTIHICNPAAPASGTSCTSYTIPTGGTAGDVTISQVVNNTPNNTSTNAYTAHLILDDVTGTGVGVDPLAGADEYVGGLYSIGRAVTGAPGYSRFSTTTTNVSAQPATLATPVWGSANLGSTSLQTPCPVGSIFSNIGGGVSGSKNTIYVCEISSGTSTTWVQISK